MANFEPLLCNVVSGNINQVKAETKALIKSGINPLDIIYNGLVAGMAEVGVRFKKGEMFVPEVLMSSKAMMAGIDLVKPLLIGKKIPKIGKVIIGTVQGDLHDIGKNLVAMMMEGAGFEIIDLGIDVPAEKFIQAVKENHPQVVGMSALLPTTMVQIRENIKAFQEAGVRNNVKVD